MAKDFRLSTILSSLIMLAIGVILFLKPEISVTTICYAIAIVIFILAASRLIEFIRIKKDSRGKANVNLFGAIVLVILAIYFLIRPNTIAQIIPIVIGIILAADGIALIFSGFMWSGFLPKRGLTTFVIGIVCVIFGIFLITHSFATQVALMQFIGITMVVSAVFNIWNQVMIERADDRKKNATNVKFDTTPDDGSDK